MVDLTTHYMGLQLRNPLIASAGPLNAELDNIRRLEDLGAGAVVLPSIFEEQIMHEQQLIDDLTTIGTDSHAEVLTYFPAPSTYAADPSRYLDLLHRAAKAVDIPVIASLNGITDHGWLDFARQIEAAGASAVELNIYFIPVRPRSNGAGGGAALPRHPDSRESGSQDPGRCKNRPLFQRRRQHGAQARSGGRRRACAL